MDTHIDQLHKALEKAKERKEQLRGTSPLSWRGVLQLLQHPRVEETHWALQTPIFKGQKNLGKGSGGECSGGQSPQGGSLSRANWPQSGCRGIQIQRGAEEESWKRILLALAQLSPPWQPWKRQPGRRGSRTRRKNSPGQKRPRFVSIGTIPWKRVA